MCLGVSEKYWIILSEEQKILFQGHFKIQPISAVTRSCGSSETQLAGEICYQDLPVVENGLCQKYTDNWHAGW